MVGRCLFIAIVVFVTGGCGGEADDGFPTGQRLTTRPDGEVWIADFKADGLWTDRADRSAALVLAQPGNVASV